MSDKVGVAILATDRLRCTMRLIESMRKYTSDFDEYDLWVFDDSSNSSHELERYIDFVNKNPEYKPIVYIKTGERIGIAKNTNCALHYLQNYTFKFILNNDMVIKRKGWVNHYVDASIQTDIHHFCFLQRGLWGAGTKRPIKEQTINDYEVSTIYDKPHGCLFFLDNLAFQTAGYFDNKMFKGYGKSHWMWSFSVSQSGIQPEGIHDTRESNKYFKVFDENCITPHKERMLDYKRNTKLFEEELKKLKSGEREIYTYAE